MANKIPVHVIEQYGSARAFKAKKRAVVKEMRRLISELALRTGDVSPMKTINGISGG